MLTIEDIKALVKNRELEKINIELKSWKKILTVGNSKPEEDFTDLAYEIAAFANRYGGKLIIGISNDGTFDGKFTGDIDGLKGRLFNLCRDKISPVLTCEFQFIGTEEWDVFIVHVPKRRHIPHAIVPNRNGHEIKSRIYYIRTNHGKKLLSDTELEWMFKNQDDPDYTHKFRLLTEFNKSFGLIDYSGYFPKGNYYVNNFLDNLTEEEKNNIKETPSKLGKFMLELFPYLLLRGLSDYFTDSWYIGIKTAFDRTSSGKMNEPHSTESFTITEIPVTGEITLNKLSWNFMDVLKSNLVEDRFHVPPNTKLRIEYKKKSSIIHFENPLFNIQILVGVLGCGSGLHQRNPVYEVQRDRFPFDAHDYVRQNFYYFDGAGWMTASFEFPEFDIDEFKRIHHYYNTLKNLIDEDWNFDKVLENLPHKDMRIMHSKVDDISRILTDSSKPNSQTP